MTARGREALVRQAALDVRRAPEHRAELGTQLLLGERVEVLGRRGAGQWLRVRSRTDGYVGWARSWGVWPCSTAAAGRWQRNATARVAVLFTAALDEPRRGTPLTPLFWGSRLVARDRRGGWVRVALPDGRLGWVDGRCLDHDGRRTPTLVARIRSLLGVPYLWGGRTPAGLDCSGFTQLVLAERGVALPRDSRHQFRASRPLERGEAPRTGDLVFFGRAGEPVSHVGISLGNGTYVHCRGTVRLASLDPLNPLCDRDLLAQFRGVRRAREDRSGRLSKGTGGGESA